MGLRRAIPGAEGLLIDTSLLKSDSVTQGHPQKGASSSQFSLNIQTNTLSQTGTPRPAAECSLAVPIPGG
jgi:S-adenosylmethionine synthetase